MKVNNPIIIFPILLDNYNEEQRIRLQNRLTNLGWKHMSNGISIDQFKNDPTHIEIVINNKEDKTYYYNVLI